MKNNLLYTMALFTMVSYSQNILNTALIESYNGTTFENSIKTDFVYDGTNRLTSETESNWNSGSAIWEGSYKSNYIYLTGDIVKSIRNETWNGVQFENEYISTFSYNPNNDIISFLGEEWDGIQWENAFQGSVTYSNNLISTVIFEEWDGTNWLNDSKNTRTYNGNNVSEVITENWNGTQWETYSKSVFTYNSNNAIIKIVSETWNGTTWEDEETTTFELDSSGNRTKSTKSGAGLNSKEEYNYDFTEQMSTYTHPFKDLNGVRYLDEDYPYINKVLSVNSFDYNNGTNSFEQKTKTTYNYNGTVGIDNLEQNIKYNLFPNPTKESIEISGVQDQIKVNILNVFGQIVLEDEIKNHEKINIQNLSNGLYFLQFENGKWECFLNSVWCILDIDVGLVGMLTTR